MRLLIVCPRFPEYGYKGDQLRSRQLIELLAPDHEVSVIAGGPPSHVGALAELRELAGVTVIKAGVLARGLATIELLARGRPAEVGWMLPRRLRLAVRAAGALSDVILASTVRVVSEEPPVPMVIDHIDTLSANMRERARLERNIVARLAARVEAPLLSRHERLVARWATAQIAVSAADAKALPQSPRPVVIPHAVAQPPGGWGDRSSAGRDIDLIFTGNMNYPPNRDGAEWLAGEIVPALRRLRPGARVVVAGRCAGEMSLDGVELMADVPDLSALLRRARVAIVPLRGGTGVANKLLEAAVAGAAIVGTPRPVQAAGITALTANDAPGLAAAVARALGDDSLRDSLAQRARCDLERRAPSVVAARLAEVLERMAS
jgi:polysaccharide biosynthesis protein PslH